MTLTLPLGIVATVAIFATASLIILAILGAGLVWYVFTK